MAFKFQLRTGVNCRAQAIIGIALLFVAVTASQGIGQSRAQDPARSARIEFICEDLGSVGLSLVPPSLPEYAPLLAQIKDLIEKRPFDPPYLTGLLHQRYIGEILPEDRDTSAILLNRSGKTIAAIKLVWRFEEENSQSYVRSFTQIASSVLLPFEGPVKSLMTPTMYAYWQTILPGSKRYFGGGFPAGENTDVRPPRADEVGPFSFSRRKRLPFLDDTPVKRVTLALDGVMFDDGTFVGPNREHLWEQIVYDSEAHMQIARLARDGHDAGTPPERILTAIE
jgi:hypothetical protein